jgi:NAD(P)-dependent dehydrogenase (short-subunit alcohol dehydrogenase family)
LIKNKKILITGNTSGLGLALTELLLAEGNKVYSLSKRLLKKRKNLKSQVCNLANLNSIDNALNKLLKTKKIDYVFLNAGILGKIDLMKNIKLKEIKQIFKINVFSNKKIIDYLIKKKIRVKFVIGISSGAALSPKYGWYLYCSSKSALKYMLEAYALEHPKIKFINLSPGLIKTKMQKQIYNINEKKIPSVKKFKKLNDLDQIALPYNVAKRIIDIMPKISKKKNGTFYDSR